MQNRSTASRVVRGVAAIGLLSVTLAITTNIGPDTPRRIAEPTLSAADSDYLRGANPCRSEEEEEGTQAERAQIVPSRPTTDKHAATLTDEGTVAIPADSPRNPHAIHVNDRAASARPTDSGTGNACQPGHDGMAAAIDVGDGGYTRPDGDMAVGPNYWLNVNNGTISYGSKTTAAGFTSNGQAGVCDYFTSNGISCNPVQGVDLTAQYTTYGTTVATSGGRFVMAGVLSAGGHSQQDWIGISNSQNPAPTAGWRWYRFDNLGFREGQTGAPDGMGGKIPGTDKWSVTVTKTLVAFQSNGNCCGTLGWDVFSLAALANGTIPNDTDLTTVAPANASYANHQELWATTQMRTDYPSFHAQIPATMPANMTGYQVQATSSAHYVSNEDGLEWHRALNGTPGNVTLGVALINPGGIKVSSYIGNSGTVAPQSSAGAYVSLMGNTVMDAHNYLLSNGNNVLIWGGHQVCPSDANRECAYVYKYDMTASNFVTTVFDSVGANILNPAVTADGGGVAFVFYTRVTPTKAAADAAVMTPNFNSVFATGVSYNSNASLNFWGDYAGAALDPNASSSQYVYGIAQRDNNGYDTWAVRATATGLA